MKSLGEIAYSAFWDHLNPGEKSPGFNNETPQVKESWEHAAHTVKAAVNSRYIPQHDEKL